MSAQQEVLIKTALTAIFYYINLEIYQQAIEECDAILELESFQNMGKRHLFLFWKAFAKGKFEICTVKKFLHLLSRQKICKARAVVLKR